MEQRNPPILVQVPSYSVASALHWTWALRSVPGGEFQGSDQGIGATWCQSLNPSNWSWIKFCYVSLCLFFWNKNEQKISILFWKLILLSCSGYVHLIFEALSWYCQNISVSFKDSPWNGATKHICRHSHWNLTRFLAKLAEASEACKITQTALVLAVGQGLSDANLS